MRMWYWLPHTFHHNLVDSFMLGIPLQLYKSYRSAMSFYTLSGQHNTLWLTQPHVHLLIKSTTRNSFIDSPSRTAGTHPGKTRLEELYTCLIQPHIVHGHRNSHWEITILSPYFYLFEGVRGVKLYRRVDGMQLYILFQTPFGQATAGKNIKFKLEKNQVYHNFFFQV